MAELTLTSSLPLKLGQNLDGRASSPSGIGVITMAIAYLSEMDRCWKAIDRVDRPAQKRADFAPKEKKERFNVPNMNDKASARECTPPVQHACYHNRDRHPMSNIPSANY